MSTDSNEYYEYDEYGREIEVHPRLAFTITGFVLAVVISVFLFGQAAEVSDQKIPQGATERGWVACWNKANHYEGQGSIVWDYAANECMEVVMQSRETDVVRAWQRLP